MSGNLLKVWRHATVQSVPDVSTRRICLNFRDQIFEEELRFPYLPSTSRSPPCSLPFKFSNQKFCIHFPCLTFNEFNP